MRSLIIVGVGSWAGATATMIGAAVALGSWAWIVGAVMLAACGMTGAAIWRRHITNPPVDPASAPLGLYPPDQQWPPPTQHPGNPWATPLDQPPPLWPDQQRNPWEAS